MSFPKSQKDFEDFFRSEDDCIEFIYTLRWPHGFICPGCKSTRYWKKNKGRFECRNCHKESTVTNGTIFHKSTKSLMDWFKAIWWVAGQQYGIKTSELQKAMGLGSYQTALSWSQKIRYLMMQSIKDKLNGTIELDEVTLKFSLLANATQFRLLPKVIIVAQELEKDTPGRLRLVKVGILSPKMLEQFMMKNIETRARIITSKKSCFEIIDKMDFVHETKTIQQEDKALPNILRIAHHFESWYFATNHIPTNKFNLDYLIGEYIFRHKGQMTIRQGLLFSRLMEQAVQADTVSFKITTNENL